MTAGSARDRDSTAVSAICARHCGRRSETLVVTTGITGRGNRETRSTCLVRYTLESGIGWEGVPQRIDRAGISRTDCAIIHDDVIAAILARGRERS